MQVRLAFSIAIRANTEILLIDEVLAVGDAKFQEKCFQFFDAIKGERTVVFVSHDMKSVKKYCDRALVLEKSKIIDIGRAEDMALRYSTLMANEELKISQQTKGGGVHLGSGEATITEIELLDSSHKATADIQKREPFGFRIHFRTKKPVPKPGVLISIFNSEGAKLFSTNTVIDNFDLKSLDGRGYIDLMLRSNPLAPGNYKINGGIFDDKIFYAYDHFRDALTFTVRGERESDSSLSLDKSWKIVKQKSD